MKLIPFPANALLLSTGPVAALARAWLVSALLLLPALPAAAITTIVDWTVNTTVPDNNITGLVDTRNVASTITGITSVEVRLKLSGGWNGDLYGFLQHDSGFSVLLNRPGKTSGNPIGSSSSGFDITLSDDAIIDLHDISGAGLITGLYQPDARNIDPDLVLDTDARTAYLSSFQGLGDGGDWTLFLADNAAGDESTLLGWGLTIIGVPEPSRAMLLMLGLGSLVLRRRRRG